MTVSAPSFPIQTKCLLQVPQAVWTANNKKSVKPPTGQSPAILQSGCQSSRLDAQSRVTRGEKLTGEMTKDPVLREMQGMFNGT